MKNKKNNKNQRSDSLGNGHESFDAACNKDGSQTTSMPGPLEDWIDTFDVMKLLHISRRTIHSLCTDGILPYSRFRHKLYYKRSDIERILHDNYIMYKLRNGNK